MVVRNAMRHCRRSGLSTAVGSASGLLCWGLAAAIGVAGVLAASATAFTALNLAGAGYLVYLGLGTRHEPLPHRRDAVERAVRQIGPDLGIPLGLEERLGVELGVHRAERHVSAAQRRTFGPRSRPPVHGFA